MFQPPPCWQRTELTGQAKQAFPSYTELGDSQCTLNTWLGDTCFRRAGIHNSILSRSQGRNPTSNGQKQRQNENLNNGLHDWNQQNWLQRCNSFICFHKHLYGRIDPLGVTDEEGCGDGSNSKNYAPRDELVVLIKPVAGHTGDEWPEVVPLTDSSKLTVSDK